MKYKRLQYCILLQSANNKTIQYIIFFQIYFGIKRIIDVLCISYFTQICLLEYKLEVGNPPKTINQIGQFDFMG